jgi:hypothetical protein
VIRTATVSRNEKVLQVQNLDGRKFTLQPTTECPPFFISAWLSKQVFHHFEWIGGFGFLSSALWYEFGFKRFSFVDFKPRCTQRRIQVSFVIYFLGWPALRQPVTFDCGELLTWKLRQSIRLLFTLIFVYFSCVRPEILVRKYGQTTTRR